MTPELRDRIAALAGTKSQAEIASELGCSQATVSRHKPRACVLCDGPGGAPFCDRCERTATVELRHA